MKEDKKQEEIKLASYWSHKFKEAIVAKEPYTRRWIKFWEAYKGEYFKNTSLPEYRSNAVSNYIFAIIETIRPIMLDNDPKFIAMPRNSRGVNHSDVLQQALTYEFDRERMNTKLYKELIHTLVLGTAVFFLPFNKIKDNVNAVAVNPFNIFPDPLATSVEDAEYIIYASYKSVVQLREEFPDTSEDIVGGDIKYDELVQNQNVNQRVDNQVLVIEVWTKDYELYEEYNESGKKKVKRKYPNGRVLTIAPDFNVILEDKPNPYNDDGRLPFFLIKDYDVPGAFWGEGEVAQLLSPQEAMNDLVNAVVDNAKATANMPWIVDKNAGIPQGAITARPGLIIRKNPGTNVEQKQPPQMPLYVRESIEIFKTDMEQISGAQATLRGDNETGVYTAQGILALQEAGQTRIRLKVKILEEALGLMATAWVRRMKQFWHENKWINMMDDTGEIDVRVLNQQMLTYEYDVYVSAGSTMPINRGAMLDLMLRLAQTPMPDGENLVDREAVAQYLPPEIKSPLLKRMRGENVQLVEMQEQMQQFFQQTQEQMAQIGQSVAQLAEESRANDEQIFGIIEEMTDTIADVKEQILQLEEEHVKMLDEREEEAKTNQIKSKAYNDGYRDAEQKFASDYEEDFVPLASGPDNILEDLESMSDEELMELYQENPEALDSILNS